MVYIYLEISRNRWCHVEQWCNLQGSYEQTPLVPVSLIKFVQHAVGITLCVQQPSNLYSAWSEPWTKIYYSHSTVNSSTISWAYISNFKPTMPEDPRPRPRLKGGRLTYAMLGSFTKIRTSSKVIRIYLAGRAIKIPLKWGVNQLSRVRNKEGTAI